MEKKISAATVKGVAALLAQGKPGQHAAGSGLYLKVNGIGQGSWVFRYKVNGITKRLGLGSVSLLPLAEARQMALEKRQALHRGDDPAQAVKIIKEERKARSITFEQVAAQYIEAQRPGWKNAKHAQQWENTLKTYALPVIGNLSPAEVTTEHVLQILRPIWKTKPETASRVRNRVELVLNYAKAQKLRAGENPATWRGNLEFLLAKGLPQKVRKHHPALPWQDVPRFWQALNRHNETGAQALKLLILTGCRTGEVLGAHWREFDQERRLWVIPANRMKAGNEHVVPLSDAVLALLDDLPKVSSGLLFEGQKEGKPLSNMALTMHLRRMQAGGDWMDKDGQPAVPHGFRSTFRTWAGDCTSTPHHIAEMALAHTVGSAVVQAYARGDLLEHRRRLMDQWAAYATGGANEA